MNYLQLFADHEDYLAPLDDAERGRLLTAMMGYCFRGDEPELTGNERYVWPVFRRMIDHSRETLEKKQAGGRNRHAQHDAAIVGTSQQTVSTNQHDPADGQHPSAPMQHDAAQASAIHHNGTLNNNQESRIMIQESDNGESGGETPPTPAKRTRFTPPTPADVSAYCREKGYAVDADRFCDFYASKGWRVGNQPMKDWQAAVRTWATRDGPKGVTQHGGNEPARPAYGAPGDAGGGVYHLPDRIL